MTLETLISELQYTNDIEREILRKIRKNESLSVVTYLLLRKYDDYKSKGISDNIISPFSELCTYEK